MNVKNFEQKKALDGLKADLIRRTGPLLAKLEGASSDFRSQLRNVLDVARAESTPEVVTAFVRYQAARDTKAWTMKDFHKALIGSLRAVAEKGRPDHIEMDAVRHLLGYLLRGFYAQVQLGRLDKGEG